MTTIPASDTATPKPASAIGPMDGLPFRLACVVLLAGTVRRSGLSRVAGRSRLDLPLGPGVTLGGVWSRSVSELRGAINAPDLPMLIATNSTAGSPRDAASWQGATVRMDSEEPRGSGGALRDIAAGLDADDRLLVAPAHSLPREQLAATLQQLAECSADVAVHADDAGAPTGFFLIRCGAMRGLPSKGFVDLKEQALPQIASRLEVRVVRTDHTPPIAIRTLDGYVRALRAFAKPETGPRNVLEEDWQCRFTLLEEGARVDPSARLHDAIVLAGGTVAAGAVVVRCLVGPGGVVAANESVFDELIGAENATR